MESYLAVTIDTECDKGPEWRVRQPIGYRSVLEGAPQRLQPLFNRFGAKPTYLLSPEMIEHDGCVETLKKLTGAFELGTHLHGEFIEPDRPPMNQVTNTNDMQRQYPAEVERAKLENLTKLFELRFGYKPTSFRAGRFGIGNNSLKFLDDLGYLVDSSVTPYAIHDELSFWGCPTTPYRPSESDPRLKGSLRILEAPVTIHSPFLSGFPDGWLLGQGPNAWWFRAARKILGKEYVRPIWLRPSFRDFASMKRVIDAHLAANRNKSRVLLVMMFHSVEVIPAASPYAQTESDVNEFMSRLEQTLDYCQRMGTKFIGLGEAAGLDWQRS
jgi:hypothetical protein